MSEPPSGRNRRGFFNRRRAGSDPGNLPGTDPGNLPGRQPGPGFWGRLFGRRRQRQRPAAPPEVNPRPSTIDYSGPPERQEPENLPPESGGPPAEPYQPGRFDREHEYIYGSLPATHDLTPEEDMEARELYRNGFMGRGATYEDREAFFEYLGMDPRQFDWEEWKEVMGYA